MAGYKRPRQIEFRDAIPVSAVGKVLRRVLRGRPSSRAASVARAAHIVESDPALATRFLAALPAAETPEHTEGREGFFHLTTLSGNESRASAQLILRDFAADRNRRREDLLRRMAASFEAAYPGLAIRLQIGEQYRNMKEILDRYPVVVHKAREAIQACGLDVITRAIRGGTDGAHLCFMGVPTPNLFAGGLLFHSRKEWIPVTALVKCTQVILELSRRWAEDPEGLAPASETG